MLPYFAGYQNSFTTGGFTEGFTGNIPAATRSSHSSFTPAPSQTGFNIQPAPTVTRETNFIQPPTVTRTRRETTFAVESDTVVYTTEEPCPAPLGLDIPPGVPSGVDSRDGEQTCIANHTPIQQSQQYTNAGIEQCTREGINQCAGIQQSASVGVCLSGNVEIGSDTHKDILCRDIHAVCSQKDKSASKDIPNQGDLCTNSNCINRDICANKDIFSHVTHGNITPCCVEQTSEARQTVVGARRLPWQRGAPSMEQGHPVTLVASTLVDNPLVSSKLVASTLVGSSDSGLGMSAQSGDIETTACNIEGTTNIMGDAGDSGAPNRGQIQGHGGQTQGHGGQSQGHGVIPTVSISSGSAGRQDGVPVGGIPQVRVASMGLNAGSNHSDPGAGEDPCVQCQQHRLGGYHHPCNRLSHSSHNNSGHNNNMHSDELDSNRLKPHDCMSPSVRPKLMGLSDWRDARTDTSSDTGDVKQKGP